MLPEERRGGVNAPNLHRDAFHGAGLASGCLPRQGLSWYVDIVVTLAEGER